MSIKKVLVSQPKPVSERNPYQEMAEKYGVEFDFHQLIHVEGLSAREFRQQRINPLDYTAVLCNSRLAIDHYFRMCEEMRIQVPESMHYYCISEAVANYLQKYIQYRKRKVFFAEHNRFDELLPAMMFKEHDIEIQPAVMYRTVPSDWPEDEVFDHDMVVLFTPAGAHSLKKNFPDLKQGDKVIACFGANTAAALQEMGFTPDIMAPTPDCPSITTAINRYFEAHLS